MIEGDKQKMKNKQFIVRTDGYVIVPKSKAYALNASSEEEAQFLARNCFAEEFSVYDEKNIYIKSHARTGYAITSFIFLIIAILLSFIPWMKGHDAIWIRPDLLSSIYAILFYSIFVVRFKGIRRTIGSWIDLGFCVVMVLLMASFIRTILLSPKLSILGVVTIPINTAVLLPITILLSVIGRKAVSFLCFVGIAILALCNLVSLNIAMGLYGVVYSICSFIGILLYLYVEPATGEFLMFSKRSFSYGKAYIKNDYNGARNEMDAIKQKYHSVSKNKIDSIKDNATGDKIL